MTAPTITLEITEFEWGLELELTTSDDPTSIFGLFGTREQAEELLALFAKSTRMKLSTCSGGHASDEPTWTRFGVRGSVKSGSAICWTTNRPSRTMDGTNETGLKRLQSIVRTAEKAGWTISRMTWKDRYQERRQASNRHEIETARRAD